MSTLNVIPTAVMDSATRIDAIAADVHDLQGRMSAHLEAAQSTPIEGALKCLMASWARMLPEYALAGSRLGEAVSGAGLRYVLDDMTIAGNCDAGRGGA